MKITPLEIRQKTFEKGFRGYDKEEVDAFLQSMSQEWEALQDQKKELKIKVASMEKEVEKMREVETSLYKTLKTAETTGVNIMDQAKAAADLHLKEAQMSSDALMSESNNQARNIIEEAEQKARIIVDDMENEIKELQQSYRAMGIQFDNLLTDLTNLANDTLQRTDKAKTFRDEHGVDEHLKKSNLFVGESREKAAAPKIAIPKKEKTPLIELEVEAPKKEEEITSFFDQIED